ncbi:MAG: AraC family transcriptional regulator ligand-binding domain-containing protein [Burkholderiaceae bacterium]
MKNTHYTISILQVRNLLLGARQRGIDVAPLLSRVGIAPQLLESPLARVSQLQYSMLIRVLRHRLRDELWGMLSRPLAPGSFGQCMRQLLRCANLAEALRDGFCFYHLLQDDFVPRLRVHGSEASVQIVLRRPADPRLDYGTKIFLLFTFNAASWLIARRIPLTGVDYTTVSTSNESLDAYQVAIRYGQPHLRLRFDARVLALPVMQSLDELPGFLRDSPANLLLRYRDKSSVAERTRGLLRRRVGTAVPTLQRVGEALSINPQTLRRRLHDEGYGFQQLKDEVRRDAAIEYLLHTTLPLGTIANRIGFSELSTFHRAFKQWVGVAPGEYRAVHGPPRR